MTGWRLADNRAEDPIPATTLDPGAYLIVGGGAELAAELPAGVALVVVEDGRIGNGLANGGDRVVLIDPAGATVDGVSWGSDQSITTLAPPPRGQTLSRGAAGWVAAPASPGATHTAAPASPPAEAAPEPEPSDSPAEEADLPVAAAHHGDLAQRRRRGRGTPPSSGSRSTTRVPSRST